MVLEDWLGRGGALAAAWFCVLLAHAQAPLPPDASVSEDRRAQERERTQRDAQQGPDRIGPSSPRPEYPWPATDSPCFAIRRVVLAGASAEEFEWALANVASGNDPAVGRCLGVAGINVAIARVQAAVVARGFVTTRILAAPQDLSGGALTLTVVPGRVRRIRFAPAEPRATANNALPVRPGDVLDLRAIEQGLENLQRLPTAQADIRIEPGDAPDESDVVISWKQAFPFRVSLSLDDSGSRATGKYQGSATLSYDHWWTLNDLFYVTLSRDMGSGDTGARGTRGHTFHYSVPWGYWLLGITAGNSRHHQTIAGATQDYIYSGTSDTAEAKVSRIIRRDASRKTTASLKGWLRRTTNYIDDTEVQTQRRATGGWEIGLAHREYMGRALLDLALAHRRGTGAFGSLEAPEQAFGEGTARFRLTAADAGLQVPFQALGQRLRYGVQWRAQWNGTPLTPQDRFAIGGRYTVRGFDRESSLAAERGWFVRNDLSAALSDGRSEAYVGLDHGHVHGPSASLLPGQHLAGAVIGLRGSYGKHAYDVFVGKPISRPALFRTASSVAGFTLHLFF